MSEESEASQAFRDAFRNAHISPELEHERLAPHLGWLGWHLSEREIELHYNAVRVCLAVSTSLAEVLSTIDLPEDATEYERLSSSIRLRLLAGMNTREACRAFQKNFNENAGYRIRKLHEYRRSKSHHNYWGYHNDAYGRLRLDPDFEWRKMLSERELDLLAEVEGKIDSLASALEKIPPQDDSTAFEKIGAETRHRLLDGVVVPAARDFIEKYNSSVDFRLEVSKGFEWYIDQESSRYEMHPIDNSDSLAAEEPLSAHGPSRLSASQWSFFSKYLSTREMDSLCRLESLPRTLEEALLAIPTQEKPTEFEALSASTRRRFLGGKSLMQASHFVKKFESCEKFRLKALSELDLHGFAQKIQDEKTMTAKEAIKSVGSVIQEGAVLGLASGLMDEISTLAIDRMVSSGAISKELADSEVFRSIVRIAIPSLLMLVSQYDAVPRREFLEKASELALKGESARNVSRIIQQLTPVVSGILSLPSAKALEDRLGAAE